MTNYNDGKWHRWSGEDTKPASVHNDSEIKYVWLNSSGCSGVSREAAGEAPWRHVLAFRVTEEHREPREWIVRIGGVTGRNLYGCDESHPDAFKVREVIE